MADPYLQETGGRPGYEKSARSGLGFDKDYEKDPLEPLDKLDKEDMVRVENFYEYDHTVQVYDPYS